jgi:predicted AlkP superfamily pyrophosphatase or phosphodiesterase
MTAKPAVLLSIPGLRERDVAAMPQLRKLTAGGEIGELVPGFPCVTCPVQANMTTGLPPWAHGVIANGFYWREPPQVEMWTAPNECIERPQIWDILAHHESGLTSAVWFPLHSLGCEADYVCTPAPIHNPDGSESLWCYTRPLDLYGRLRDKLGHFPLQHFWGPMANIASTAWIAASAVEAAKEWTPDFFYIYLPHLDYAAQRSGPDSPAAVAAVAELDGVIGKLSAGFEEAYGENPLWLVAGEYAIVDVDHVTHPNRMLRAADLLGVRSEEHGEHVDLAHSRAFAMVDHQFSHVFVSQSDAATIRRVVELFDGQAGIAEVLVGSERAKYQLDHPRSGDVILISTPNSWQSYGWWLSDDRAPGFARRVDIHQKPGYDPLELFFDPIGRGIPLDTALVKGSHGAPADEPRQRTVLVTSQPCLFSGTPTHDTQVFNLILGHFGISLD